jgi:Holliday junction resolvase RusA-like endonuclease
MKYYLITPVAKPRMTRSDKWKKRKCVLKYWAYRDEIRLFRVKIPESNARIIFYLPMPDSWSKKKKEQMLGKPHQQKPDIDNLVKGILDATYKDDSTVWDIKAAKYWGRRGEIYIAEDNDS